MTDASYIFAADTATTKQWVLTNVNPGQTYWFKVLAKNIVGNGPSSDSVNRIAASVPNAPTNLVMIS